MTAHQAGVLLLSLAIILIAARLFGILAKRIGQPPVVGEIFAGILVGPTLFNGAIANTLFPTDIRPFLSALANVGLVLFMFIVGYELDHTLIRGKERVAVTVSIGSILLPFGLGAVLAVYLLQNHPADNSLGFVLFIGASMSVTAFPVLARILTDRGMHRTAVGGLALASAAVDDVLAWSLLAVVITVVGGGGSEQWHVAFAVPYVLAMFLLVRPLLRKLVAMRDKAGRLTPGVLAIVLIGLLLSSWATEWMGVHFIFGAFVFGAVMPREAGEQLRHEIMERLEQVSVLLLLPVFFVVAGLKVNLATVGLSGLGELGLILAVAIIGKFVGAFIGARLQKVPTRQAGALATLMNTRGLTEIVILTVGLQLGVLDESLFSLMVVMAVVTTVMAGPLLNLIYPKRRVDRDIAEAERAALGTKDAYRVLVVVKEPTADGPLVDLGVDLVGANRPAEVVLSHLVPYKAPSLEVGTGLSGELLEMTRTMGELDALGARARAKDVPAPVLSRFTDDVARDLPPQVAGADARIVVVSADQPGYQAVSDQTIRPLVTTHALPTDDLDAVVLHWSSGSNGTSAAKMAALIASGRGLELVIVDGAKPGRRAISLADELVKHGVNARAGSVPEGVVLVVAGEGSSVHGAHLVVRAEQDAEPVNWSKVFAPAAATT